MFSDTSDEDVSVISNEYEKHLNRNIRRNYSFRDEIPDKLNKLRKDKAFCDVILRSGSREVYAHRIILATLSDYFTLLFKYQGGFNNPVIVLDENMITGDCLENIVSYAYTGETAICKRNVCDLLMAADYFDIPFIRSECEKFLNVSDIINLDNLSNLIWMVCHYNLRTFLDPICSFVSNHFAKISETVLLYLSPHCMLTLLKETDLTVLYNGIPADHVEFELFKLVMNYINKYDLSDNSINELLQVIQLSELTSDEFWSVVESSPRIRNNEAIICVSNFHALPSYVEEGGAISLHPGQRLFSRAWKFIDGLEADEESCLELDDRIKKITIYTLTGIPSTKPRMKTKLSYLNIWDQEKLILYGDKLEDEYFASIIGISLTYKSGKKVKTGETSEEAIFPLDVVSSREFTLDDKEVIVNIPMAVKRGLLKSIKFVTNVGNVVGTSMEEFDSHLYHVPTFSPKRKYGYLHSFGKDSTIDSIKFLWVEYLDPKVRQEQKEMQLQRIKLLQQMAQVQHLFPTLYDDDYYHDDGYYNYDSDSSGY